MGWRAVTVVSPLVIIKGATGGEFVYDGAGNLRAANVGATTTDPLQGITCQQGISTFNGHGAVISLQATALDAYLLYADTGTSTQGALIASEASAKTTDPFGNTVYAGVVSYATGVVNAITQLLNGFLQTGTPGQIAGTGGAAPGLVGLASGGNPGVVRVDSGLTATGDADAFVDVRSKNAQSSINGVAQRNIQCAGPLALSSEGSAPSQLVTAAVYDGGSGFARMRPGTTLGDTTVYQVGQATFRNTVNQTGVSGVVTGLSAVLGAGLYRFSGVLSVTNPSAGTDTPEMGFSGTGGLTAANLRASIEWFDSASPAAFHASGQVTALGSQIGSGSTIAAGASAYAKFDGIVNISAAGTFNVIAGLVAGTSLTALAFSYITYWPVN